MFRPIVLFFAILTFSKSQASVLRDNRIRQCTHNSGELPLYTGVHGCVTPPCLLPQQQDAVFDIIFSAPRPLESMRTLFTAYWSLGAISIPIPFYLGESAITCNSMLVGACPIAQGAQVASQLRIYVEEVFAVGTEVDVEISIVDENMDPVNCFRVAVRITEPYPYLLN